MKFVVEPPPPLPPAAGDEEDAVEARAPLGA
jgi:hypothetical protein